MHSNQYEQQILCTIHLYLRFCLQWMLKLKVPKHLWSCVWLGNSILQCIWDQNTLHQPALHSGVFLCVGAIVGGDGAAGSSGGVITAGSFIKELRDLSKDKSVEAVVLRVDSPGGDALASDLMWREIRKLAEKKPVVASMGDVAASGG